MGCAHSKHESTAKNRNFLIEQNIRFELGKRSSRSHDGPGAIKVLLLGAGESGKSTILKQMKLIHGQGFTSQERSLYAQVMWESAISQMLEIIRQARFLGIALDCDDPESSLHSHMALLSRTGGDPSTGVNNWDNVFEDLRTQRLLMEEEKLPMIYADEHPIFQESGISVPASERVRVATAIAELWSRDEGIKRCFARSNEYQLEDSASYYFENVYKLADQLYLATDGDIVKGRIKTTGISENPFLIGNQILNIIDVGGQRSERKKWIHCFADVDCVLFVASLSEYDQALYEDSSTNRMQESLTLFDNIYNSKWFANTAMILFLNKTDILKSKIIKSPVRKYFPSFNGPNEMDAIQVFFKNLFFAQHKCGTAREIYVHYTCATDTENMRFVLASTTDMILTSQLRDTGVI